MNWITKIIKAGEKIKTAIHQRASKEDVAKSDKYQTLLRNNPSGRLGHPSDIGGMIAYLCSDKGGFVNGQMLQINGGTVVQF